MLTLPGKSWWASFRHLQSARDGLKLRMLGGALVYDRTRANPRNFNATHWIGHASAMEHGTIFFDLKILLSVPDENGCSSFTAQLPEAMLPSFSSAYNTAFVTVSYGLCLHSDSGEVLAVEPVTVTQNAPEESGRMNKKTRLATFVTRNLNWCGSSRAHVLCPSARSRPHVHFAADGNSAFVFAAFWQCLTKTIIKHFRVSQTKLVWPR